MPAISVIVPSFNTKEQFLIRCVNSVIHQEFNDYELLLIDDGSDKEYQKVYDKIIRKDRRIRFIQKDNEGVYATRNLGVNMAEGDYIVFLDADDELDPHFLIEAYSIALKSHADLVVGGIVYTKQKISYSNTENELHFFSNKQIAQLKPHIIYDLIRFGNNAYISRGPSARLIKRQIAKQNPFDSQLKIGEDLVWNLELLNQCQSIVIVHRIWYIYYYNGESVTHKFNRNIIEPLELELNKINQLIDWNNKAQVEAYYSHILEEIGMISDCYLNHAQVHISRSEKKERMDYLKTNTPWSILNTVNINSIENKTLKFKLFFYKHNTYLQIRRILLKL